MVTSRLGAPGQGTESAPPCGPGLGLPGADSGETLPSASGLDMHAWTKLSSRFCLSLFVGSPGMCWLLGSITNLFASLCPCAGCGVRGEPCSASRHASQPALHRLCLSFLGVQPHFREQMAWGFLF